MSSTEFSLFFSGAGDADDDPQGPCLARVMAATPGRDSLRSKWSNGWKVDAAERLEDESLTADVLCDPHGAYIQPAPKTEVQKAVLHRNLCKGDDTFFALGD